MASIAKKHWYPIEAVAVALVVHLLMALFFLDVFEVERRGKEMVELPPSVPVQLVVLPKSVPVLPSPDSIEPETMPLLPPVSSAISEKVIPEVIAEEALATDEVFLDLSSLEQLVEEESSLIQRKSEIREVQTFVVRIIDRISTFWSRPLSAYDDMVVELNIQLVPAGDLVGVRLMAGSGDDAFDRSALLAVQKASPLPVPDDPLLFDRYFRSINLKFSPKDL